MSFQDLDVEADQITPLSHIWKLTTCKSAQCNLKWFELSRDPPPDFGISTPSLIEMPRNLIKA